MEKHTTEPTLESSPTWERLEAWLRNKMRAWMQDLLEAEVDKLGLMLIPASSPQAKGRVERLWGTFQDGLVSELRLAGTTTHAEAQAVLVRFLPHYNRRFAKPAATTLAWRGVDRPRLAHSLCFKYRRMVAKDNTVAF